MIFLFDYKLMKVECSVNSNDEWAFCNKLNDVALKQ